MPCGQMSIISMKETNEIVSARLEMICALINKCLTSAQKKDLYKILYALHVGITSVS